MKECWKPIPNYEGMYEASDRGRIRSVSRTVRRNGGTNKTLSGRVLVVNTQGNGYKCVTLSKDGCVKTYRVHRLVAITFIPNPKGLPEVNHINENKAVGRRPTSITNAIVGRTSHCCGYQWKIINN